MGHDKFPNLGSFSKLISDMVLFWNLFLHVVVFYVKSMQIAEAIGDFGLAVTHGTGLASATSDFRMHGTHQFDWRVALGEVFYTV